MSEHIGQQGVRWRGWSCPRGCFHVPLLPRFAPCCPGARTCWPSSAATPFTRPTMSSSSARWRLPMLGRELSALSTPHADPRRCAAPATRCASTLPGGSLLLSGPQCSIIHDRLPKKLLFDQVKGCRPLGRPRSIFNEIAVRHCPLRHITKSATDARNRLL